MELRQNTLPSRIKIAIAFILIATTMVGICTPIAERLLIADFLQPDLNTWQQKIFKGITQYEVVNIDNRSALKAVTKGSASALYKTLDINLHKTPYLNWSWRVDNVYTISDQTKKSGDDYPARLYVVVKEGIFPWQTKALNYVWSNTISDKSHWNNPFTANAVMIPVRKGSEGLGQWHQERVNVKEDFLRIFNRSINEAHGVAIMSDSDNAQGAAVAYYGTISFSD